MNIIGCEYPLIARVTLSKSFISSNGLYSGDTITNLESVTYNGTVKKIDFKTPEPREVLGDVCKSPITVHLWKKGKTQDFRMFMVLPKDIELVDEVTVTAYLCHRKVSYFIYNAILGETENVKPNMLLHLDHTGITNTSLLGMSVKTKSDPKNVLEINTPDGVHQVHDYILKDGTKDITFLANKLKMLSSISTISGAITHVNQMMHKCKIEPDSRLTPIPSMYPICNDSEKYIPLDPLNSMILGKVSVPISEQGLKLLEDIKFNHNGIGKTIEDKTPKFEKLIGVPDLVDKLLSGSIDKGFVSSKYTLSSMVTYLEILFAKSGHSNLKEYNTSLLPLASRERDSYEQKIKELETKLNEVKLNSIKELEMVQVKHVSELFQANEKYHKEHMVQIDQLKVENDQLKDTIRELKDTNRYQEETLRNDLTTKFKEQIDKQKEEIDKLNHTIKELTHSNRVELDDKLDGYKEKFRKEAIVLMDENKSLKNTLEVKLARYEHKMLELQNEKRVLDTDTYGEMLTLMYRYKGLCELLVTKNAHKQELRTLKQSEKLLVDEFKLKDRKFKAETKIQMLKIKSDITVKRDELKFREQQENTKEEHFQQQEDTKEQHFQQQLKQEQERYEDELKSDVSIKPEESELNGYTTVFDSDMIRIFVSNQGHHRVYHTSHGWLNVTKRDGVLVYYTTNVNGFLTVYGSIADIISNPELTGESIHANELFKTKKEVSLSDLVVDKVNDFERVKSATGALSDIFLSITDGYRAIRGK